MISSKLFSISFDEKSGGIKEIILKNDEHKMNFVKKDFPLNGILLTRRIRSNQPTEMELIEFCEEDDCARAIWQRDNLQVVTEYTFTDEGNIKVSDRFHNLSDVEMFPEQGEWGIVMAFADEYPGAKECMTNRCHTHIWCGLSGASYVCCLKMGLEKDNLGLLVTKGGLKSYSQYGTKSNDRGWFLMHPDAEYLSSDEDYILEYEIFPCADKDDFLRQCMKYDNFINIKAKTYTVIQGEDIELEISGKNLENIEMEITGENLENIEMEITGENLENIVVTDDESVVDECNVDEKNTSGNADVINTCGNADKKNTSDNADVINTCGNAVEKKNVVIKNANLGEYKIHFKTSNSETDAVAQVIPEIDNILKQRVDYIVDKQQYHKEGSHLDGAYLVYDFKEEKQVYDNEWPDCNASRERVGMGILVAYFLRSIKKRDNTSVHSQNNFGGNTIEKLIDNKATNEKDTYYNKIFSSLMKYEQFIRREIYDEKTGCIYDGIQRDETINRLYNFLWVALFYAEMYRLTHEKKYQDDVLKIVRCYYNRGGIDHYPNAVFFSDLLDIFEDRAEYGELKQLFLNHAYEIMKKGSNYPKHEVNYEQTIVAPAVAIILDAVKYTEDRKSENHIESTMEYEKNKNYIESTMEYEKNKNYTESTMEYEKSENHIESTMEYEKNMRKELYMSELMIQTRRLERFDGFAPHYKLNEVAIRYWDAYWFGKSHVYGDTLPHYWSCLSSANYYRIGKELGMDEYLRKGVEGLKNCLCLFFEDGSASCASVFPFKANGLRGEFMDEYSNDQDFALYYGARFLEK